MKHSRAQIVATIGPSSSKPEILKSMLEHQMDVARLNFAWGSIEERRKEIGILRKLSSELKRDIPIIVDLPGPRMQKEGSSHTYDSDASPITEKDIQSIKFGIEENVEYFALSFVSKAKDIEECREIIKENSGDQKIIAKIEREVALKNIEEIIAASDAVMVARGDLGNDIPIEKLPFAQDMIIKKAKKAGKPVIVATEMLLSMKENPRPTRAEVTDVANAILEGADAVMLSEETTIGKYPVETVTVMEKIVLEAEKHLLGEVSFNRL